MDKFIVTSDTDDIIGSIPSRAAPVRGRRAIQSRNDDLESSPTFVVSQMISESPEASESTVTNRPKRRRQTWDVTNEVPSQDQRLINNDLDSESDEHIIPTIPDLDEADDEETMQTIAVPPAVFQDLLSYRELDSDLMRQSAFSMLDNEIDLKVLTKSLVREKELIEPEEVWELNQLFTEIQSLVIRSKERSNRDSGKEMLI